MIFSGLRWIGVIMIAVAGLLSAVQTKLGKSFGYLVLYETGYSLLAVGLARTGGLNYLAMLFIPRLLSYAVISLALSALVQDQSPDALLYTNQAGLFRTRPIVTGGILIGIFSLLGLPLLPLFPHKQMLWLLTAQLDPRLLLWVFAGSLGLLLNAARLIRVFSQERSEDSVFQQKKEKTGFVVLMASMILLMVAFGASTQFLLPRFLEILTPFTQLVPTP
jgi:formate hydrogenlyase subunit 3/multisubunit Na+/H+ antiporter MnhD subunit